MARRWKQLSDEGGGFHMNGIKPGRYKVAVIAAGFEAYQQAEVTLAPGSVTRLDAGLNLGAVTESLEVIGKRATARPQGTPQRIRVGGSVQASKLLHQVPPVYPESALQKGIEGTLMLRAVIGVDGRLLSLSTASASADPDLTKAALDAVQQWIYEPTLLNGEPMEVATTITVTFRLQ